MKTDCYKCKWRRNVPGDAHSSCANTEEFVVLADKYGVDNGWVIFPFNFDPVWIEYCEGFEQKKETK